MSQEPVLPDCGDESKTNLKYVDLVKGDLIKRGDELYDELHMEWFPSCYPNSGIRVGERSNHRYRRPTTESTLEDTNGSKTCSP